MTSVFVRFAVAACATALAPLVRAQVTYIDADWVSGNTVVAATGLDPETVYDQTAAGNVWNVRPYGNGGSLLQGRGDAVEASTPELETTIGGLATGHYDLYVFYWSHRSVNSDWSIRAGLTSGALIEYDTTQPLANSLTYAVDPLFEEDTYWLYAAKVGENVLVDGGSASIYVNDLGSTASNDRTWYDGVGYSLYQPPPDGVNYVAGDLITFTNSATAPNGAWSWFEDERVVVDVNAPSGPRIVVSSVSYAASGSEAGDVDVLWYDVNTGSQGEYELHDRLQNDDHNSAALWIRPDGRYLASYSSHTTGGGVSSAEAKLVRYRVSTNPHDPTAWNDEFTYNADGFRITTYSNLHYLPGDDEGQGRLYNFHRNVGFDPHILVSDDHGDSWTAWGNLFGSGGDADRPYLKYASNGEKIFFTTTERHPQSFNASIFAGYVQDGRLHSLNGAVIDGDLSSGPPVDVSVLESVFDVNSAPYQGVYSRAWTVDMAVDAAGNPYAVFQARIDPGAVSGSSDPSQHMFFYARYGENGWNVKELALAGGDVTPGNGASGYTGLVALHPHNPDRLFISTDVDPRSDAPTSKYEIYEGRTNDDGATWTWSAITENSTMDNVRPIVPEWEGDQTALLWMRGGYTSYTQWSTEVVGLIFDDSSNADFDDDGDVDGNDFLIWQRGVGQTGQTSNSNGDANGDGLVDGEDLAAWKVQATQATFAATPSAARVPEPTAGSLLYLALAIALASRRVRQAARVAVLRPIPR